MEWILYVIVGLFAGLNLGYMIGVRRGTQIESALLGGIIDGVSGVIKKNGE